jgi:hypothetical protein
LATYLIGGVTSGRPPNPLRRLGLDLLRECPDRCCDPRAHGQTHPGGKPDARRSTLRVLWSSFGSGFPYDFGFAETEDQMLSGHLQKLIKEAPDWLEEWW